jgi:hypothetical protein
MKGSTWKEIPIDDKPKQILGPTGKPIVLKTKKPMGFGVPK